jgi:hypothetical protein
MRSTTRMDILAVFPRGGGNNKDCFKNREEIRPKCRKMPKNVQKMIKNEKKREEIRIV